MHSVNCLGQKVAMLHSIAIQRVDHGKNEDWRSANVVAVTLTPAPITRSSPQWDCTFLNVPEKNPSSCEKAEGGGKFQG
ncbi:hypothetical protein M8J76_002563 [Diaphorina citri]|nr:hypothetical protein M8J75_006688 [Diaphorina citri]KAI5726434.1 hypothetical protein M8J76_002563 [Diaphorina citri]KAI5730931.1 hypothetical protein M8J77_002262 [Diaphorina citri]